MTDAAFEVRLQGATDESPKRFTSLLDAKRYARHRFKTSGLSTPKFGNSGGRRDQISSVWFTEKLHGKKPLPKISAT